MPPPPPRSRAVRHPAVVFLNFLLTAAIVSVLLVGATLLTVRAQFTRDGAVVQARTVTIPSGAGPLAIARDLQREALISSRWMFVAGVYLNGEQRNLKAGEYLIEANASMRDMMDTFVSGRGVLYAVSIPEGLTSTQIVDRL
ncbi:MAG: endolytic transglycosylase MltG, partial [Alphaproteobacteria bacterium]